MGPDNQSNMQIIDKAHKKIKFILESSWFDELMWLSIILFVAVGSFSVGVIYEKQKIKESTPIEIQHSQRALDLWDQYHKNSFFNQEYLASKNGTIVYPVGCAKANKIKKENIIYFADLEDAVEKGYTPTTGC